MRRAFKVFLWLAVAVFAIVLAIGLLLPPTEADKRRIAEEAARPAKVAAAVAYLGTLDGVAGYRITGPSGNNIWIAFKGDRLPADVRAVATFAALKANLKSGFGAHVYITSQASLAKVPDAGFICTATARYGKVQKWDCP